MKIIALLTCISLSITHNLLSSEKSESQTLLQKFYLKDPSISAQEYYDAVFQRKLIDQTDPEDFLSFNELTFVRANSGFSKGSIYTDKNNDVWFVKKGQSGIHEYIGSRLMNLIWPWSPEVKLFNDSQGCTGSKLLKGFSPLNQFKPNHKPIKGEFERDIVTDLIGLQDRSIANKGFVETNDAFMAARVDFDHSFHGFWSNINDTSIYSYSLKQEKNISRSIFEIERIANMLLPSDDMLFFVTGHAINNLLAVDPQFSYQKYQQLTYWLINRKNVLTPLLSLLKNIQVLYEKIENTPSLFNQKDYEELKNLSKSIYNETPLYMAIYNKRLDVLKLLLSLEDDPDVQNLAYSNELAIEGALSFLSSPDVNSGKRKSQESKAFYEAIKNNQTEIVKLLLIAGADPNAQELLATNGQKAMATALLEATKIGHVEIVKSLLKFGANPNSEDSNILYFAASNGYTEIVELLLEYGADPWAFDSEAVRFAALNGHTEIIKLFIRAGSDDHSWRSWILDIVTFTQRTEVAELLLASDPNCIVFESGIPPNSIENSLARVVELLLLSGADPNYSFPLFNAVREGQREIVELLLKFGANPNTPNPYASNSDALYLAAEFDHTEILELILKADLNSEDSKSQALRHAVQKNHIKSVELLLKYGVDPDAPGSDALYFAVAGNHTEILELLLKASVCPEASISSALQYAVKRNDIKSLDFLLKYGANPHELLLQYRADPDILGFPALCSAAENGYTEIIELLLAAGVDPKAEGSEAFFRAVENGHIEGIQLLLTAGVDPFVFDSLALILAAENGNLSIVKLLLELNLDPKARNSQALFNAVRKNHSEIVKCLLEQGVNPNTANLRSLFESAYLGYTEIVKLLLDAGADFNLKTFFTAVDGGHKEIIDLFLSRGITNAQKSQALLRELFKHRHNTEILALLLEAGVDFSLFETDALSRLGGIMWNDGYYFIFYYTLFFQLAKRSVYSYLPDNGNYK